MQWIQHCNIVEEIPGTWIWIWSITQGVDGGAGLVSLGVLEVSLSVLGTFEISGYYLPIQVHSHCTLDAYGHFAF